MKCEHCGAKNLPQALSCEKCGYMLPLEKSGANNDPLIGTSYEAAPDDNFVSRYAARGRRFLLVFFLMLIVLFGLGALPWLLGAQSAGTAPDTSLNAVSGLALGAFGLVFAAYLIAKTGESVGTAFALNFVLALFPPFWPAVLARIGGRKLWLPYLYLAATLLLYACCAWFFAEQPYVSGVLFFLILPFLIYHLFGCAVCQIGEALGYNAYVSVLWLCLLPVVLFVFLLKSAGYDWLALSTVFSGERLMDAEGPSFPIGFGDVGIYSTISLSIIGFSLLTHLFWIRSIYYNLCYPDD